MQTPAIKYAREHIVLLTKKGQKYTGPSAPQMHFDTASPILHGVWSRSLGRGRTRTIFRVTRTSQSAKEFAPSCQSQARKGWISRRGRHVHVSRRGSQTKRKNKVFAKRIITTSVRHEHQFTAVYTYTTTDGGVGF